MHIWEITSGMYSLTAHMKANIATNENLSEIINRINKLLDDKFGIEHTTIQIEPTNKQNLV
jgi:cobalt-zinc-cadmium efflux system protein